MYKAEDIHEDPAFVLRGFKNWKKAIEKFNLHEETQYHLHAVEHSLSVERPTVLQKQIVLKTAQQVHAYKCLVKIISS